MSILGDLDDLILRETANPPLVTKGAELTYAEMDTRIIGFYDAVQSIVSGVNVTAYDAGATYDQYDTDIYKRFAGYNSRIWKAIYNGSPSIFSGQTPAEGVYWTQVSFAEMFQDPLAAIDDVNNCLCLKTYKLDIPTAQVLTAFTTPIPFGITVPAGYRFQPMSFDFKSDYNTTPYATNISFRIRQVGATSHLVAQAINYSANVFVRMAFSTAPDIQYVDSADLECYVGTGDPTAGDSDITVYVTGALIQI